MDPRQTAEQMICVLRATLLGGPLACVEANPRGRSLKPQVEHGARPRRTRTRRVTGGKVYALGARWSGAPRDWVSTTEVCVMPAVCSCSLDGRAVGLQGFRSEWLPLKLPASTNGDCPR